MCPSNFENKLVSKYFIYLIVVLPVCFKAVLLTEILEFISTQIQVLSLTLKMLVSVACLYTVCATADCG
jgi:hypothetical protein